MPKDEACVVHLVTGNPALGESALHVGCVLLTAPLQRRIGVQRQYIFPC